MKITNVSGVPDFDCREYQKKQNSYCLLIPIINEHGHIERELARAYHYGIHKLCDIIICDGGSTDGGTNATMLTHYGVNTLLVKTGPGKQGAQLRMGFWWAMKRGYQGFVTIDGNNKDSIQDVPQFLKALDAGYDFVQGSRFIKGGHAVNTPLVRYLSVRLLHAPVISLTAREKFTDTTNCFRGYSRHYLADKRVAPFRDIFSTYELLAYLSVRGSRLGMRTCEIPVTRIYPKGKTPTKISSIKGNFSLLTILFKNLLGRYNPKRGHK